MNKSFSAGSSDFAKIRRDPEAYLIDKSLLIKDLFKEREEVILIARPRRFGKTLNMSMLSEFLAKPESKDLFEGLLISEYPEIMAEQGNHPTIFLSLKDVKQTDISGAIAQIAEVMAKTYEKFLFLRENLHPSSQKVFDRILEKTAEVSELGESLLTLTKFLSEYFNKRVWIVLDEYDAPIHTAWQHDYYKEMVSFMLSYLGAAFKDNSYLYRGVMSGILRVSKENIFSCLNNVRVYSMLHPKYAEYFGFTEQEVDQVCEDFGLMPQREEIRRWYNGYKIGEVQLYNPWSILSYVSDRVFKPYWVNTANNLIVQLLIARSSEGVKAKFEALMRGESISVVIDEHALLPNPNGTDSDALWSFLLFAGYLKVLSCELGAGADYVVEIGIPNEEIFRLYISQLSKLFNTSDFSPESYARMLKALTQGDAHSFSKDLQQYLETSMSYFDAGRQEPERFYHGFVLGILVALKETHEVRSNRESGRGRYDIMVIPKDRSKIGIILEFKIAESGSEQDMSQALNEAFEQIQNQGYEAELKALNIQKILKMAAVFYKKKMIMKTVSDF